jgi:hypothetical protein
MIKIYKKGCGIENIMKKKEYGKELKWILMKKREQWRKMCQLLKEGVLMIKKKMEMDNVIKFNNIIKN